MMNCPHCNTHIDKHEASRCLNAWVAEAVMEETVPEWGKDTPCPVTGGEMRYCGERSWCSDCRTWHYGAAKEYSFDIAVAWGVLGKFQSAEIERGFGGNTIINLEVAGAGWFSAHAPRTPLAICRAAIKATQTEASA